MTGLDTANQNGIASLNRKESRLRGGTRTVALEKPVFMRCTFTFVPMGVIARVWS
jgi:hypothetical protein